ncbi:hypothetical protein BGZ51_004567 [Haplosporangium sp. Z 767]|nr:hypothetical protein BGZ51_004567 [Haplosporangium sp. Z 767]
MTIISAPLQQFYSSVEDRTATIIAQVDPTTGSAFVLWKHIQSSFENITCVRAGGVDIKFILDANYEEVLPYRIPFFEGIVLDVIQVETPAIASRVDTIELHQEQLQQQQQVVEPRRPLAHQHSPFLQGTDLGKSLDLWSKDMTPQGQKSAASYNGLYESYVEAMMAGRKEQTDTLKAHMDVVMASMMEEMAKNQAQLLEKDRETKEMQENMVTMQKRMLEMQVETLNRLVVIQSRVQAILTQTYELFEYPIPRLFIILPKEPELWDKLNPFTHKFRLYFLCECGEHTKKVSTSSKMSHHIHLAKHTGYDLLRPTEFFEKYGPYLLTMMEMIKFGVGVTGVVVPTLAQMRVLDGIEEIKNNLDFTEKTFAPLLDDSISYVKSRIGQDHPDVDLEGGDDLTTQEALEGADLRQLASYLSKADEARTLGNLYRTVTEEGHVKWVCFDHYHDGYMNSIQRRFADIVTTNKGKFMEELGQVEIYLSTPLAALEFYEALKRTKGVHELTIYPKWDATKSEIQQLCDTILESNVSILTVNGYYFDSPSSDVLNRGSRFDPFIQMIARGKLQSFTIKDCLRFFDRISDIASPVVPTLRTLHLDSRYLVKESKSTRQKVANLFRRFPNLIEATVTCSDIDEMLELLPIQQLSQLSALHLQRQGYYNKATLLLLNGTVKHVDMWLGYIPKLAYSGFLRELEMVQDIMPLPELERLLGANTGLAKLRLKMPQDPFEYIFMIGFLMSTRCSPLLVTLDDLQSHSIKMEFWMSAKAPPAESTGKWIQLPHSMVHFQEWRYTRYNFQQFNSNVEIILSGLKEIAHDADEVILDLDMSLLTESRIRALQKAMTSLRPKECHVVFKKYKQEWAHCYDFDPVCWSRLEALTMSGEDMATWLLRHGSVYQRELMPSLQVLSIEGQGDQAILSSGLADWLASMVSPNGSLQRLKGLTFLNARFSHKDWKTILGNIDYSSLDQLRLHGCDLGAFPGSRKKQAYSAADLCRYVGLEAAHLEQAAVLDLGQAKRDNLLFTRKRQRTVQET